MNLEKRYYMILKVIFCTSEEDFKEYKRWDRFINVIENAKMACEKSAYLIGNHFSQVGKMIELAKGAKRTILDYKLSRYARELQKV